MGDVKRMVCSVVLAGGQRIRLAMVSMKNILSIAVIVIATASLVHGSGFLITVRNVANTPVQFMVHSLPFQMLIFCMNVVQSLAKMPRY
jgi:hypothetical protein